MSHSGDMRTSLFVLGIESFIGLSKVKNISSDFIAMNDCQIAMNVIEIVKVKS
jgi:hypothetical protein